MNDDAITLEATVEGPPPSMGSKRGFVNPRTGAAIIVDHNVMGLRQWQDAMRHEMRKAIGAVPPDQRPWFASVSVILARPRSHFTKKGARTKGAPELPTVKPDPDKIARAVFDCGSGIWWQDDKQIVSFAVRKRYADQEGAVPGVTISAGSLARGYGAKLYFLSEKL